MQPSHHQPSSEQQPSRHTPALGRCCNNIEFTISKLTKFLICEYRYPFSMPTSQSTTLLPTQLSIDRFMHLHAFPAFNRRLHQRSILLVIRRSSLCEDQLGSLRFGHFKGLLRNHYAFCPYFKIMLMIIILQCSLLLIKL